MILLTLDSRSVYKDGLGNKEKMQRERKRGMVQRCEEVELLEKLDSKQMYEKINEISGKKTNKKQTYQRYTR